MVLDPANDGSGYPSKPGQRLPTDRPVDGITDLMIDGDIFVAENGQVARVIPASGWSPQLPSDTELRPESAYTMLSSPILANGNPSRRVGALYAFDAENHRIVAFNKSDGKYLGQYRLQGDDASWADLKGIDVLPVADADAPSTLWWISSKGLNSALLEQAPEPTPSASPGASSSAKPPVKPAKTPKPAKTKRP